MHARPYDSTIGVEILIIDTMQVHLMAIWRSRIFRPLGRVDFKIFRTLQGFRMIRICKEVIFQIAPEI